MEMPQQFESFSKRFAEHAPYPVFFVNEAQRVCWLNGWAGKKESVSGGQFLNSEIADVLFDWGIQADEVGEALLCFEGGYPQRIECVGDAWLSMDIDVVFGENHTRGFIVALLPRRLGDAPSKGDENVHRLIGLMTHEARGQLHAISGFCELLQTGELRDSGWSEELDGILLAKDQLSNLWEDAEDLVELFGDLEEPKKERFSLSKSINEVVESTADALAKFGNEVHVSCEGDVPSVLIGNHQDFQRLAKRMLLGLGRSSMIGIVPFRVSWANPSRLEKSALRLDIGDDKGESIDWTELDQNVDSNGKSGISMTIARRLVNRIGGRLFRKSVNGVCRRVSVDLMLDPSFENGTLNHFESKGADEIEDLESVAVSESSLSGLRMIVVDDNEVTIEVNRKLLQQLGARDVIGVKSGREALELHSQNLFDVAFLDLKMPDMDGYELAQRLRSESENSQSPIRIVAITAGSARDSKERSLLEGFDDCLIKPVVIMGLRDVCFRLAKELKADAEAVSEMPAADQLSASESEKLEVADEILAKPVLCLEEWKNDPALHRRMLAMLLEDAPQTLKRIEDEVAAGDPASIERVVHYFKGSVDVVRADRLSAISDQALALIKDGEMEAARALLMRLQKEYLSFTKYLQEIDYLDPS